MLRPADTKLFKNRDADSLAQVIAGVKDNGQNETKETPDAADSIASYVSYYSDNVYN